MVKEKAEKVETEEKKLKEIKAGDSFKARAVVVRSFEPRFFEVCPECGKRALENECKTHGKVTALKRAILNIVLDDGTGTIRGVIFGEQINKLGITDSEIFSLEEYEKAKKKILGEEKFFSGQIRTNNFTNELEFYINGIDNINSAELIKELEQKVKYSKER